MSKAALAGLAVIVAGAVLAPTEALADRRHHGRGRDHSQRLHSTPPHRFFPKRFHGHGPRFGVIAPPVVIYSAPAYATPIYTPPPVYYPPSYTPAPPAYSPPVTYAPPPMQTVIEFPTGRYELRGDGITTPYRWVWIPNPPTSPPADAPPVEPSGTPATSAEPTRPAVEPTRRSDVYRWTDDDGVVHLSDRLETVPEAYRARVRKSQS